MVVKYVHFSARLPGFKSTLRYSLFDLKQMSPNFLICKKDLEEYPPHGVQELNKEWHILKHWALYLTDRK